MSSWPGRAFPSKRQRVERLRKFWEGITSQPFDLTGGELGSLMARGDVARGYLNQMSAAVGARVQY